MGVIGEEIVVTGTVDEVADGDRDRRAPRPSRTASGSSATPWPRSARRLSRRAGPQRPPGRLPTISGVLTERQELVLRKVVEEYLDAGAPVGSKALAAGVRVGPVDDPPRAGEPRGARAARASAHVRRPGPDRGRLPLLRRPAAARADADPAPPLSLSLVRRELDEAMRVTTETLSQVTNLLAIVTAPPIDTSTIRHVEVLAAAAAGPDGRRDHLDRRRHQAAVHVRARRSTRASPTGPASYLNERLVGLGLGARMLHAATARPVAVARPSSTFLDALLAGVHRARGGAPRTTLYVDGTSRLLRGRALRRRLRAERADGHARAPRDAARGAALGARRARRAASGSAPRTTRRRCARWRSSPPATGCRSATSARCR